MVMFQFRAKIVFGLNVLTGKTFKNNIPAIGDWDFTNAESFIRYTVKNNYSVAGWELGMNIVTVFIKTMI